MSGYSSDLARYTETDLSVVLLSNVESVVRDQVRLAAAAVAMSEDLPTFERKQFRPVQAGELSALAGAYRFGPGFVVTISDADGRLFARANQGGYSQLMPLQSGAWFSRMLQQTVSFEPGPDGSISKLIWGLGGGLGGGLGDSAPVGQRLP